MPGDRPGAAVIDDPIRAIGVVVIEPASMRDALQLRGAFQRVGSLPTGWRVDLIAPPLDLIHTVSSRSWHTIVVPPIERWVGLHTHPVHDWFLSVARPAHRVVGVGTGTLLLAFAGLIDGRAVVATPSYAAHLAALTPTCVVHLAHTAMRDGHVNTATNCAAGVALCEALASEDRSRSIGTSTVAG